MQGYGVQAYGITPYGTGAISVPSIPSDRFDQLLTGLCGIYRRRGGNLNSYGIPQQDLVLIEDTVRCRLSTTSPYKEFTDPKQVAIRKFEVFMRPRSYDLVETHWLLIEQRWFNVENVLQLRDAQHLIHHLQVYVSEVMPSKQLTVTSS